MTTQGFALGLGMVVTSVLLASGCSPASAQKPVSNGSLLAAITAARPAVSYTDAWDEQHGTLRRTWSTGEVMYRVPWQYREGSEAPGTFVSDAEYSLRTREYVARRSAELEAQTWKVIMARPCESSYNGC